MADLNNQSSGQTTIIGADTHIKGDMTFDGAAKLLGTFEGKITAKGDLHIAEGATCRAVVDAGRVTVDGTVDGNVTARERVELTAKAKMKGDLVTAKLLVAEGASFVVHCTVGADAAKAGTPAYSNTGYSGSGYSNSPMPETKPMPPLVPARR
jgi:cytoskeletal protein CcmA (bactofilin family)